MLIQAPLLSLNKCFNVVLINNRLLYKNSNKNERKNSMQLKGIAVNEGWKKNTDK